MDNLFQWGLTVILSIVFFLLGQVFERRKQSMQERNKLLSLIEEWVNSNSKLVSIMGDEFVAINQRLPQPITYNMEDRKQITIYLGENREKIIGILESEALSTAFTRVKSNELKKLIFALNDNIANRCFPSLQNINEKYDQRKDISKEFLKLSQTLKETQDIIKRSHSLIAELKTSFT